MSLADLMDAKPFDAPVIEFPVRVPELVFERPTDPLIVALYGGPGTGKSTTAAFVFAMLKQAGVSVELVHEVAKDFTWEERWQTLAHQPYVIAKQLRNYDRCYGKVDCIVTDTSSLLGLIYMNESAYAPEVSLAFRNWLITDWKARRTLNVFLHRDPERGYDTSGRKESIEEAKQIDSRTWGLLHSLNLPVMEVAVNKSSNEYAEEIVEEVRCLLR